MKGEYEIIARERERKRSEYMKGMQMSKEWAGEGRGGERAAALGTCVPRMAESAFWLVGQCVYAKVVQYYCFYVCLFLQLSEFKVSA